MSLRWAKPGETYKAPANEYEKMVVDCFLALSASSRSSRWSTEVRFRVAVDEADRVFDQIAAYRNDAKKGIL